MSHKGETLVMRNGLRAAIIEENGVNDLTVQFETGEIRYHVRYGNFNQGNVGIIHNKRKCADDYIGMEKQMNNGHMARIVSVENYQHVKVVFDNGMYATSSIDRFQNGTVGFSRECKRNGHVGEKVMQNNGHIAELTEYKNKNDVTLLFDNGIVREHATYSGFIKGTTGFYETHFRSDRKMQSFPQKCGHAFTITEYVSATDVSGVFDNGIRRKHVQFSDIKRGSITLIPRSSWKEDIINRTYLMQCGLHITVLSVMDYEHIKIRFDETGEEISVSKKQIDERRCLPLGLSLRTRKDHDFCGFYVKGTPEYIDGEPYYMATDSKTGFDVFYSPKMMISLREEQKRETERGVDTEDDIER